MGLKELSEKIKAEGKKKEAKLKAKAKKEISEFRKEAEVEADLECERILAAGRLNAELTRQRIVTSARLESRRKINEAKTRLIDEAFEKAGEKIGNLGEGEKKKLLENLIGDGYAVGARVVSADKKVLNLIDRNDLEKRYSGIEFKEEQMEFGVILEDKEGVLKIDYTVSSLLESLKDSIRPKVGEKLFGEK
ncbi:MAG: V-type ATP synthase subunit E [Candidatus Altiarchaeota archaeon]